MKTDLHASQKTSCTKIVVVPIVPSCPCGRMQSIGIRYCKAEIVSADTSLEILQFCLNACVQIFHWSLRCRLATYDYIAMQEYGLSVRHNWKELVSFFNNGSQICDHYVAFFRHHLRLRRRARGQRGDRP